MTTSATRWHASTQLRTSGQTSAKGRAPARFKSAAEKPWWLRAPPLTSPSGMTSASKDAPKAGATSAICTASASSTKTCDVSMSP